MNAAVTERASVIETTQLPVPEQAPDQPSNCEPSTATAVRVTSLPASSSDEQVVPQLMPPPATVPEPAPVLATVSAYLIVVEENAAVTERAPVIETMQLPVPEQAALPPDQPSNFEPESATAVRVTSLPAVSSDEQVVPQLTPPPATVPEPAPVLVTVRPYLQGSVAGITDENSSQLVIGSPTGEL